MSEPEASEEDKVIATVVLAGWTIEPYPRPEFADGHLYRVEDENGEYIDRAHTRYTAALRAIEAMRERGLLP